MGRWSICRAPSRADTTFAAAGVADRVAVRGQSFFAPLPPGADVYVLCKVLNNRPERETVALLRRCAEAAAPGGRVLIRDNSYRHTGPGAVLYVVIRETWAGAAPVCGGNG